MVKELLQHENVSISRLSAQVAIHLNHALATTPQLLIC